MQKKICDEMKVKREINVSEEIEARVNFIKESMKEANCKALILGISGGQDSTLCGKLCQIAIDQLNIEDEQYKFYAIRMPYGVQSDEDDCQSALQFINPCQIIEYNIKNVVDTHIDNYKRLNIGISDYNKGNIKARERMIVQYALAANFNGLVVGTDHSAESITGFYTKYGDGACDLAPLFGLNKRQGKKILKHLKCPSHLYQKVPTADLEELRPMLADEQALGVSYDVIDDYLEGRAVDATNKQIIENLYLKSIHKRNLPKTL